jgi:protein-S-isoprenylcysteine O-methyltransferase Ste14
VNGKDDSEPTGKSGLNRDGFKRLRQVLGMPVVIGLALFLSAGRLDWWNGWVYLCLYLACLAIGGSWMVRHRPGVVNERGRRDDRTKLFDRVIAPFYLLVGVAQYVVAGLDERFGWTHVPRALEILGGIGFVASMAAIFWAMANNPFLAKAVRISPDRGHRVATTGPYRIVRHPMYASNLYFAWVTGCLLDSWWTLLVSALSIVILVVRTALEDRTLRRELEGYREYAAKVRYRLVPGIW